MALDITALPGEQTYVVANKARSLIFFEELGVGTDETLCYNYKTDQWTSVPVYSSAVDHLFSVDDEDADIGIARFSSGAVDLQVQTTSGVAQDATLATAAADLNQGGRTVVNGVRPLVSGGTTTVRVGVQDQLGTTPSWSTSTSLNTRTHMANFRSEGRWVRTEVSITGGFESAWGADVDFTPQGRV